MPSQTVRTGERILLGEDFELDLRIYELRRGTRVLKLERIPMEVLLFLIEEGGKLVTRDQIIERVWGKDVFLDTDNSINAAIRKIRQALKDDPEKPRFVQTITGRGYRFIASIREAEQPHVRDAQKLQEVTTIPSPAQAQPAHSLRSRPNLILVSVVLSLAVLAIGYYVLRTEPVEAPQTLAVLPFRPLSGDSADEYLELGMADALITKLSRSGRLIVRPTSAIRKYTSPDADTLTAGRVLQVDSVLEGNIQHVGDRLRVSLRLLRVRDGSSLWSDSYDTRFTDVFQVQDTVSEHVVEALAVRLSNPEKQSLRKHDTTDVRAYELYTKGIFFWNKRNEDGLRKSISYFEQAIALDPKYALAHAGLAAALCPYGYGGYAKPEEVHAKIRAAATRAVALDPSLPEAHVAMGAVLAFYEWNWPEGEREFQQALVLNPNLALAHHWYAMLLECLGRFQEAMPSRQRALELEPVNPTYVTAMGQTVLRLGDDERALTQFQEALQLDDFLEYAHREMGEVYERRGDHEGAVFEYKLAVKYSPESGRAKAALGYSLARAGDSREARRILGELATASYEKYVSPVFPATVHAGLEDNEEALSLLEQAYDRGDPALCDILRHPRFQSLYSHPRFRKLLQKMGLMVANPAAVAG